MGTKKLTAGELQNLRKTYGEPGVVATVASESWVLRLLDHAAVVGAERDEARTRISELEEVCRSWKERHHFDWKDRAEKAEQEREDFQKKLGETITRSHSRMLAVREEEQMKESYRGRAVRAEMRITEVERERNAAHLLATSVKEGAAEWEDWAKQARQERDGLRVELKKAQEGCEEAGFDAAGYDIQAQDFHKRMEAAELERDAAKERLRESKEEMYGLRKMHAACEEFDNADFMVMRRQLAEDVAARAAMAKEIVRLKDEHRQLAEIRSKIVATPEQKIVDAAEEWAAEYAKDIKRPRLVTRSEEFTRATRALRRAVREKKNT